jgi:DnaJ domain
MLRAMHQDSEGYYTRLGVAPGASRAAITAAYRRAARRLHPDVPGTGNVEAFVALKTAYDVLRDPARRSAYDASATAGGAPPSAPVPPRGATAWAAAEPPAAALDRRFLLWIGFLVVSAALATWLMVALASGPTSGISGPAEPGRPTAAEAPHTAMLPRARTSGPADHFVLPGLGAATVFQGDPVGGQLRPVASLPAFAPVHVLGFGPDRRMAAIRLAGGAIGFLAAGRLAPGGLAAARSAFCADRAGPPPADGAVLTHAGNGPGWFAVANHDLEPAVVKLRNAAGLVVGSVYLVPGGRTTLRDLPAGPWTVDFAVGELWSGACNRFAAGERAQRFRFPLASGSILDIPPALPPPAMPVDIQDHAFAQP